MSRLFMHIDETAKIFDPRECQVKLRDIESGEGGAGEGEEEVSLLERFKRWQQNLVHLPHSVSHKWRNLGSLLVLLCIGSSLAHMIIFLIPLSSVNAGIEANRGFLYGVMTYHEFVGLLPWIETFNFAFHLRRDNLETPSEARISIRSRIMAIAMGLMAQKLFGAFLAESWWDRDAPKVFPIPFSTIVTGTVALPFSILVLYLTSSDRDYNFRSRFWCCIKVLLSYHLSIVVAGSWAVVFRLLMGHWAQFLWAFSYSGFKFGCKVLSGRIYTDANPRRWSTMMLVVEMIFARVQVSTLPYIRGQITMMLMVIVDILAMHWRFYSGADRCALLADTAWNWVRGDNRKAETLKEHLGDSLANIASGMITASLSMVHEMSLRLNESPTLRCLSAWKESSGDVEEATDVESSASVCSSEDESVCQSEDGEDDSSQISTPKANVERKQSSLYAESPEYFGCEEPFEDPLEPCIPSDENHWLKPFQSLRRLTSNVLLTVEERRRIFQMSRERPVAEKHEETHWEQRQLFHLVDAISSEIVTTIVHVHNLLAVQMIRNLPVRAHMNDAFQIDDKQWARASLLGWQFVIANVLVIAFVATHFPRIEGLRERRLTMKGLVCYVFRDHFWFLFLWLTATGSYACVNMINHFGADFSLQFQWLSCRESPLMSWPGCLRQT